MPSDTPGPEVPVLLLKTVSTPTDAYDELFSHAGYAPCFVPVLQHQFKPAGLDKLRSILRDERIATPSSSTESAAELPTYGGLVFTSQRSVEAFTKVVAEEASAPGTKTLGHVPIYSVGPATTRALRAVPTDPQLQVHGSHTGNGETLAPFIRDHYRADDLYPDDESGSRKRPGLLFPVGEVRRDVIPRKLMEDFAPDHPGRIPVDETVVYGTGVMESFPVDLEDVLSRTASAPRRWIVVFSPTGCDSMLRGLGLLDETDKVPPGRVSQKHPTTYVVTIGPTTQAHLRSFGFEPHASAAQPSPQGVMDAIAEYERTLQ